MNKKIYLKVYIFNLIFLIVLLKTSFNNRYFYILNSDKFLVYIQIYCDGKSSEILISIDNINFQINLDIN